MTAPLTPAVRLDILCEVLEPSRDGPDLIGDHDALDDALIPVLREWRKVFAAAERAVAVREAA